MPRRRRRPSKYRFLAHLQFAFYALVGLVAAGMFRSAICDMQSMTGAACTFALPQWLPWVAMVAILGSVTACARRYYLDFHQLEYYRDLEDPHWRDRR